MNIIYQTYFIIVLKIEVVICYNLINILLSAYNGKNQRRNFTMSLLGIFSIFSSAKKAIKEVVEPTIPVKNWANKELYHQDLMNGVSAEQRMKNVKNGKYKLTETHPEPHRDPKDGKIVIENSKLYYEDVDKYGAYQAQQWVKQGKYNLTPEELEKENERIRKEYDFLYRDERKEQQKKQLENQQQKEQLYAKMKDYYSALDEHNKSTTVPNRLIKEQKEQDMLRKHNELINDCQNLLLSADYTNINILFSLEKPNYLEKDYGYSSASITAKRHGEDFSVSFNSIGRLSFIEGHKLLKSISVILSSVDISDFDNRELNLKEKFKIEDLRLQEKLQEFEILDDVLSIVVDYSNPNHKVLLKFYTSKINMKQKNFDAMEGHEFEHFCANILIKNGFENVNVTSGSGDQGIDIIAFKDDIKYGIQCKCYHSAIGNKAVQEVYAGKTFYNCHIGVVLTNRNFTKSAIELAKNNGIILWDRKKLLQMIENCKDII